MHFEKQAQIKVKAHIGTQGQSKAWIRTLIFDEAFTIVLIEYFNYNNVFLVKNTVKLLEHIRMNDHAIKLEEGKQPPFGLIYSLGLVELETLKTYIKINLVNSFIQPFKLPARAFILFDKKSNKSLYLCVNYQNLNNIIIKN